jgi:hypothetical protein
MSDEGAAFVKGRLCHAPAASLLGARQTTSKGTVVRGCCSAIHFGDLQIRDWSERPTAFFEML